VDEVWNDRYSSQSGGFKERGQGMKRSLRGGEGGWGKDTKEGEEVIEIVLGIIARIWPRGRRW